jgi:hypothetical protein
MVDGWRMDTEYSLNTARDNKQWRATVSEHVNMLYVEIKIVTEVQEYQVINKTNHLPVMCTGVEIMI